METIVALDIETTGLSPREDSIIEIGAVRFNGNRIEAEWSSLINPGCRIPPAITQLTGITDQMVLRAPFIQEMVQELQEFVGDAPILGQNIQFDMAFIHRLNILQDNRLMDTYEIASVLLPTSSRYGLGSLAYSLGIPVPISHRALDDAQTTRAVYLKLFEEALKLPLHLLAEIVRLGEGIDWHGYYPFRLALRERTSEVISPDVVKHRYDGPIFSDHEIKSAPPLKPIHEPKPLDIEEVSALLEPGGVFAKHFPQFEYRSQQVEMLRVVGKALSEEHHLLVEAGTGTGKSMAYLIPAAIFATQNNQRVVISTNTINLQDQLINKDIPDLCEALGIELRATIVKGRGNYLCPRRLESMRHHGPETPEEMRVLGKVLVWLQSTITGDRSEINLNGVVETSVWSRLSAEDEGCTTANCLKRTGGICPFYRVRQAAHSAHILIVNHALLLADVATGNRVLPDYEYLIIDEAHHIEDATTDALSFEINYRFLERTLRTLGSKNSGVFGWMVNATENVLTPSDHAALNQLIDQATTLAFRLENISRDFFATINDFLADQRDGRGLGRYSQQVRILEATRVQPAWMQVESAWEETQQTLQPLVETLANISKTLADVLDRLAEEDEELYGSLTNIYRILQEFNEHVERLVFKPVEEQIYWAEIQPNSYHPSLHAAPLYIGNLMERYLWYEKKAVILTSATLTTAGEFDYLRSRLKADEADELAVGSPFDYENATLLYLVNDIPEPSDRNGHQRAINAGLTRLCIATGGRTLVLFTSYDQLKRTSQAITSPLAREGIMVFEQGDGASRHALLESFRNNERAVLLGTSSFWEGVDVPGEALSVLVIAKLPFGVPSDPIIAARSETFEDPFSQYSIPEAILRFRQGFGRLIRTQQDRGVVVIFDRRLITKRYGRTFLESLPVCTQRSSPLADLPKAATSWLNI
jgi:ATP-dependent DNA helicase DinG